MGGLGIYLPYLCILRKSIIVDYSFLSLVIVSALNQRRKGDAELSHMSDRTCTLVWHCGREKRNGFRDRVLTVRPVSPPYPSYIIKG